ncbi:hypothetical protein BTVI_38069 [Pitangus sulphuratus]|nr:hypothetical protein BTVI_38069 [Pitangus sulphuratus]
MPAGSRTDFLPLAKASPIRSNSNASVVTCLRTEGCCTEEIPVREEQSENMGTTMQTPSHQDVASEEVHFTCCLLRVVEMKFSLGDNHLYLVKIERNVEYFSGELYQVFKLCRVGLGGDVYSAYEQADVLEMECLDSELQAEVASSAIDTTEGQDAFQRDVGKLEKWAHGNMVWSSKAKCKVLHLDQRIPHYQSRLGDEQIESNPAEKEFGVLVDNSAEAKKIKAQLQCAVTRAMPTPNEPNLELETVYGCVAQEDGEVARPADSRNMLHFKDLSYDQRKRDVCVESQESVLENLSKLCVCVCAPQIHKETDIANQPYS